VGFDPAEQLPVPGLDSQRAAAWQATSNRTQAFAAAGSSGASASGSSGVFDPEEPVPVSRLEWMRAAAWRYGR